jgi:hypothetical protein
MEERNYKEFKKLFLPIVLEMISLEISNPRAGEYSLP